MWILGVVIPISLVVGFAVGYRFNFGMLNAYRTEMDKIYETRANAEQASKFRIRTGKPVDANDRVARIPKAQIRAIRYNPPYPRRGKNP